MKDIKVDISISPLKEKDIVVTATTKSKLRIDLVPVVMVSIELNLKTVNFQKR